MPPSPGNDAEDTNDKSKFIEIGLECIDKRVRPWKLDEPAHGSIDEETGSITGGISGVGLHSPLPGRKEVINKAKAKWPWLNRGRFQHLWPQHDKFLAELCSEAVRRNHWALRHDPADVVKRLTQDDDLAQAIHDVALANIRAALEQRPYMCQLQFLLTPYVVGNRRIREALLETYSEIDEVWKSTYRQVLEMRGLAERVSLEHFTYIMTAGDEGLTKRVLIDPRVPAVDETNNKSLLGLLGCFMAYGLLDRRDGRTIEEALNEEVRRLQSELW
ncbi:hypothetical protein FXN61_00355 [Lentzea sp. PSKA42]|uniref:DUF5753 domain-containing protein n=1 Tax=Lentzea indica TaxID=2604800 RepID=A0ABX1F8Y4_9PSEU|nr:hypothetical protein [Lentzea indica]NKE55358.1 hypothetical protein [Lentzea indica]